MECHFVIALGKCGIRVLREQGFREYFLIAAIDEVLESRDLPKKLMIFWTYYACKHLLDLLINYLSAAISRFWLRLCKNYSTDTPDICFSAFVAEAATSAK